MRHERKRNAGAESQSVFADLGFAEAEARALERKAQLMTAISRFVVDHELTQIKAAHILNITQPRVSDLLAGRMSRFSLDSLIELYERTGSEVRISVERLPAQEMQVLARFDGSTRKGTSDSRATAGKVKAAKARQRRSSTSGEKVQRVGRVVKRAA